MTEMRKETDSLGVVEVPADKLWGAQTQRSLEHFSIGKDLIPREMITAYATLNCCKPLHHPRGSPIRCYAGRTRISPFGVYCGGVGVLACALDHSQKLHKKG